jgi:acyl carrier protein
MWFDAYEHADDAGRRLGRAGASRRAATRVEAKTSTFGGGVMDRAEIQQRIKQIISNVTNIPPDDIADAASFTKDLDLDSLSLLEIGVDVDYEFQLGLPEERMRGLDSVDDTLALVEERLRERQAEVA